MKFLSTVISKLANWLGISYETAMTISGLYLCLLAIILIAAGVSSGNVLLFSIIGVPLAWFAILITYTKEKIND
jgi:hypothetical protein